MTSTCTEEGCDRPARGRGLCGTHYAYRRRHGALPDLAFTESCTVDGCGRGHEAHGLCGKHYQRLKKTGSLEQPIATADDAVRFWSKVDTSGGDGACWPWTAGVSPTTGYGNVWWNGTTRTAHRVAFELARGAIPAGLELDHVKTRGCIMRHCVNPAHLEPVQHDVNNARSASPSAQNAVKTHCKRGHEFTPENTYRPPKHPDQRACRACLRASSRAYADRIKSARQQRE